MAKDKKAEILARLQTGYADIPYGAKLSAVCQDLEWALKQLGVDPPPAKDTPPPKTAKPGTPAKKKIAKPGEPEKKPAGGIVDASGKPAASKPAEPAKFTPTVDLIEEVEGVSIFAVKVAPDAKPITVRIPPQVCPKCKASGIIEDNKPGFYFCKACKLRFNPILVAKMKANVEREEKGLEIYPEEDATAQKKPEQSDLGPPPKFTGDNPYDAHGNIRPGMEGAVAKD